MSGGAAHGPRVVAARTSRRMSRPLRCLRRSSCPGVTEEAPPVRHTECTQSLGGAWPRSRVGERSAFSPRLGEPPSAPRAGVRLRTDGRPMASRMANLMPNHMAGSVSAIGGGSPDAGRAREDRGAAAGSTWWIDRSVHSTPQCVRRRVIRAGAAHLHHLVSGRSQR